MVLSKAILPKKVQNQSSSIFETLEALKGGLRPGFNKEDFLVQESIKLDITDDDIRRENVKQILK